MVPRFFYIYTNGLFGADTPTKNTRMKKLFLLFVSLVLALGGYAIPSDKYQLIIKTTDGDMTFMLSQSPKISFTATDLLININGIETTVSKSKLLEFTFEVPSSLFYVSDSAFTYRWLSDGNIELTNFESIDMVQVFSVSGQVIMSQCGVGISIIPLNGLPSGIYLLNINNSQTLKITKP